MSVGDVVDAGVRERLVTVLRGDICDACVDGMSPGERERLLARLEQANDER